MVNSVLRCSTAETEVFRHLAWNACLYLMRHPNNPTILGFQEVQLNDSTQYGQRHAVQGGGRGDQILGVPDRYRRSYRGYRSLTWTSRPWERCVPVWHAALLLDLSGVHRTRPPAQVRAPLNDPPSLSLKNFESLNLENLNISCFLSQNSRCRRRGPL
jgi:hypothetical protein